MAAKGQKGAITMNHKNHKVLGAYCWDCKVKTANGIPGFERNVRGDGPRINYMTGSVVWADGTRDWAAGSDDRASCVMCKRHDCNKPVHEEKYIVKSSGLAKAWDQFNPVI